MNGKTAARARADRDYGIVFQDSVLFEWRTVAKNIALPLELAGWSRERRRERVHEMLDLVELTGSTRTTPGSSPAACSSGSRSPAPSFSPALLLMDEPFGALDEMTRERLNIELRIWEASGSTIVFVTHSIAEAVFLSTRVSRDVAAPWPDRGIVDIDLRSRGRTERARSRASRADPRRRRPCAPAVASRWTPSWTRKADRRRGGRRRLAALVLRRLRE